MITSSENKQMKRLSLLNKKSKERQKEGVFPVEGIKMFLEAPKDRVENIYVSDSFLCQEENRKLVEGFTYEVVADSVFRGICDTMTPQGILTLVRCKQYAMADLLPKDRPAFLLLLESIQDPGNLGTMIRTGEGAGLTGVIVNKTTADLYQPKTIRSTMGSIYRVPHLVTESLPDVMKELQSQNIAIYGAHLKGSVSYLEGTYTGGCGLLIGNEGNGLTREAAEATSQNIRIDMEGQVESLNAAMAAGILMYEVKRQRKR